MSLLLELQLAIEEDLLLFLLKDERGLTDRVPVATATCGTIDIHEVRLLIALLIGCLRVRFAVEDHLLPRFIFLEDV